MQAAGCFGTGAEARSLARAVAAGIADARRRTRRRFVGQAARAPLSRSVSRAPRRRRQCACGGVAAASARDRRGRRTLRSRRRTATAARRRRRAAAAVARAHRAVRADAFARAVADAAVVAADLPDAGRGEKKFAHFRAFGLVRREIGGVGGREFFFPVQVAANASRASANACAHRAMREKKKRDCAETRATLGFQRGRRNSFAQRSLRACVVARCARARRPSRAGRAGEEKIAGVVDSCKKRD
ncbi:hypothetical protein [Lysobacter sp. yr284]|uniref:hypothetical protein n=1 Tax=Lysobacter sp. yr284 TaxID=1761791 RepID=UPI00111427C6|nr:hypothetical protein [Lysobacter sp. yr284]